MSRDQEHVAHLYKHLSFSRVRLITLSEGAITEFHVGLAGAMSAIALRRLAEKTHRGLRGRVKSGKSGGGLTFRYDVVHCPMDDGTVTTGERKINTA